MLRTKWDPTISQTFAFGCSMCKSMYLLWCQGVYPSWSLVQVCGKLAPKRGAIKMWGLIITLGGLAMNVGVSHSLYLLASCLLPWDDAAWWPSPDDSVTWSSIDPEPWDKQTSPAYQLPSLWYWFNNIKCDNVPNWVHLLCPSDAPHLSTSLCHGNVTTTASRSEQSAWVFSLGLTAEVKQSVKPLIMFLYQPFLSLLALSFVIIVVVIIIIIIIIIII
jgi:hypothetical protein